MQGWMDEIGNQVEKMAGGVVILIGLALAAFVFAVGRRWFEIYHTHAWMKTTPVAIVLWAAFAVILGLLALAIVANTPLAWNIFSWALVPYVVTTEGCAFVGNRTGGGQLPGGRPPSSGLFLGTDV